MAEQVLDQGAPVEPLSGIAGVPSVALTDVTDGPRYGAIDVYHRHFLLTQDDGCLFDWDGYIRGYGPRTVVAPGWYVPLAQRRPLVFLPLSQFIVGRLTAMTLGVDNEPTITVAGDEDAEALARALAKSCRLFAQAIEARDLGGACGSVVLSYGFVEGEPRVEIHNAKDCRVLTWADRAELVVGSFLKTYAYTEEVIDERTGRFVDRRFFYARFIDGDRDLVWERIPEHIARDPKWATLSKPDREAPVLGGVCPVVWIQNRPQTAGAAHPRAPYDGPSDYEGLCDDLATAHRLKSATVKGTIANVDPTLVVKTEQKQNTGSVRKGSGAAIYSPGGAEYLSLPGDAMTAAKETLRECRADILDAAGVVAPSNEEIASAAKSAAALRILFAPMTAVCSLLRVSYGKGLEQVLRGLLRLAREIGVESLSLPVEYERLEGDDGAEMIAIKLTPGSSDDVRLVWPPFFSPTWTDKQLAVTAAKEASGGKPVISHRTAVQAVAQLFGVEDPDEELEHIEEDSDRALDREVQALTMGQGADPGDPGDDDGEEGPGARGPAGGPGTTKPEADGG